ncbi:MAG: hypothetical protein ACLFTK_16160 [Anaerolineales bacterium]
MDDMIADIRMLIGDNTDGDGVKPDGSNFTDDELTFFAKDARHIHEAAALACEALAYMWNTHPNFDADGLRVDHAAVAAGWMRAAVRFRANAGARLVAARRQDGYSEEAAA